MIDKWVSNQNRKHPLTHFFYYETQLKNELWVLNFTSSHVFQILVFDVYKKCSLLFYRITGFSVCFSVFFSVDFWHFFNPFQNTFMCRNFACTYTLNEKNLHNFKNGYT